MYKNGISIINNKYECNVLDFGLGDPAPKTLCKKGFKKLLLEFCRIPANFRDNITGIINYKKNSWSSARGTNLREFMIIIFDDCLLLKGKVNFLEGVNELDTRTCKTYSRKTGRHTLEYLTLP